jgi:siroheme synthase (precorrin-2 oxidase/ferrochelatase)
MRTVILYHPDAEFAGLVQDFKREFEQRHQDRKIDLVSLDTTEGSEMAKLYDVVRYPAILVIASDGQLQKLWQDRPFPLMDQVAAYSA